MLRGLSSPRVREIGHAFRQRLLAPFVEKPYSTVLPYTMVGLRRLRSLRRLATEVIERGIPGDVVECGTCNGGSAAILAGVVTRAAPPRRLWLLDSFQGLPPSGPLDGEEARQWAGLNRGSATSALEVLRKVGADLAQVRIVPGWFDQTLPSLEVGAISLLHVDADWYESVTEVLEALYDRVSPGGFVIFDDYGYWQGCSAAWRDFSARRRIGIPLVDIDGTGAFLRVP
jgi:O-methyltransferase